MRMEEVGDGRYRTRLSGRLPPELSRLRDSLNRMAAQLAETDADNRRLNEQLLTLQEQERTDLSRDLHDEVSPFLFAINVDAAAAARLLAQDRTMEARDHVQSIAEAVRHIQQQVRRMLGRLRPIGLDELGLPGADGEHRCFLAPQASRHSLRGINLGGMRRVYRNWLSTTICRIVQEALSNAVRHAEPALITVVIDRGATAPGMTGMRFRVEVTDDGRGMAEPNRIGYGLLGIRERVKAMGGRLTFR